MVEFQNIKLDALQDAMNSIRQDLSLPLVQTLLAVARHKGLSVNDLAEKINAPQQTASRYVATLQGLYEMAGSQNDFADRPLLSLEISSEDPRKRALYLTTHGENKLSTIIQKIYK